MASRGNVDTTHADTNGSTLFVPSSASSLAAGGALHQRSNHGFDSRTPENERASLDSHGRPQPHPAIAIAQGSSMESDDDSEEEDDDKLLTGMGGSSAPTRTASTGLRLGVYGQAPSYAAESSVSLEHVDHQNGLAGPHGNGLGVGGEDRGSHARGQDLDPDMVQEKGHHNKGKGKGKAREVRKQKKSREERDRERTRKFAREMAFVTVPSILLSMLGSVLAGEVLAKLKTWPVFLRVEELFILVPILLNLKGNLEMNLAARFSTSANIGELDLRQTRRSLILGNMALLQVQALLVSLLAGLVAFVLGLMSRTGVTEHGPAALAGHDISVYGVQRGGYFECLMVLCASMIAASVSSAVVGAFMCSLVVVSRFLKINPDNLATPLAASLGDLLALVVLGLVANTGAMVIGTLWSTAVFLFLLVFIGMNVVFTIRNAYVQELIWAGWLPLLLALAISSGTGLVLQQYVNEFRGFGLLAQVVTGVAGNVGAIFVSRISTALHGAKEERYRLTASTLFGITVPILIAFLAFVHLSGQANIGVAFATSYSLLSLGIMVLTLIVAYHLTFWLWKRDYDPDINALPLLSSAVDLLGQILLVLAYMLAKSLGGDVELPTPVIQPDGTVLTNVTNITAEIAGEGLRRVFLG